MSRRPLASALAGTLAAGLLGGLAGCGGGDDSSQGRTPTPSPTSTSAGADAGGTTGASASATTSADPTAYLPVPQGVRLTAAGSALTFGRTAVAAWQPRQGRVGVVGVRVDRVQQTTVTRSLAGFRLDATARASTPYFVSMLVTNRGATDLGGGQPPIYVVDTSGRLVPPTGVAQDFEACAGSLLPAGFAPGERTRSCLIFLVPSGARLASVSFRPPEGVAPITWTGKVTRLRRSASG
ncbi:hypothetical protein [Nocardioides plantarum]|uniref:DUF4352 domain-containing protein n=1 Tax=Nocardioides plantarum TaxID=29299 RepID=A0ABV5KEZ2_9ACTN|nr:hypothetical protein [Nocardioides plantarum]